MVTIMLCVKFSDGLHDLTSYIKYILKALRELKKSSALAYEMLKLLSDGQETSAVSFLCFTVSLFKRI